MFSGTSRRYGTPLIPGQLSIKTVRGGEAAWVVGRKRYAVRPRTWLLLTPADDYRLEIESHTPATTFCLFFQSGFFEDVAAQLAAPRERALLDAGAATGAGGLRAGIRLHDARVTRALDRIGCGLANPDGADWMALASEAALAVFHDRAAEEAMNQRLACARPATRAEVARRVRVGTDYLLSNASAALDTRSLARAAGMSEFHFHRSFQTLHGTTPHRFLQHYRLDCAAALLKSTRLSVIEVCMQVGFASLPTFTATFRRRFGMPPGAWRR